MNPYRFWIKAALNCLAASAVLGLVAHGFGEERGRSDGKGEKSSGGGGTIHAPTRGGGAVQPANHGQTSAANRTPAFTAPKAGNGSGTAQSRLPQEQHPQSGTGADGRGFGQPGSGIVKPGVGQPGVGRPGIGAPGVGAPGVGLRGAVDSPHANVGVGLNTNIGAGNNTINRVGNTHVGVVNGSLGGNSINLGNRSVSLAASGYHPAYFGHSAYHGYWNGNYGSAGYPAGYYGGYYGYGGSPYSYFRPLGWGLGAWGLGALAYNSGYLGYSNPYYNGYAGYNYSQPIPVMYVPTAGDMTTAEGSLNAAMAAFQQNDLDRALDLVNQGITQSPNDSVLHEFRALVLFARADYQQAAATIHSVLALGPGWNWTTLSSMYNDLSVYTTQLRSLEAEVRSHPDDGAARFLLAYHYMTAGHTEAAARHLQQVVTLVPTDRVAADLLKMISPPNAAQSNATQPPATVNAASAAQPVDPAALVGTWTAARDDGSKFSLSLTNDATFTWNFSQKGQKSQDLSGKYTVEGQVLALEGIDGGSLIANVTPGAGKKFNFKLLGAPAEDPGLDFSR